LRVLRQSLSSSLRLIRAVAARGGAPLAALRASDAHHAMRALVALSGHFVSHGAGVTAWGDEGFRPGLAPEGGRKALSGRVLDVLEVARPRAVRALADTLPDDRLREWVGGCVDEWGFAHSALGEPVLQWPAAGGAAAQLRAGVEAAARATYAFLDNFGRRGERRRGERFQEGAHVVLARGVRGVDREGPLGDGRGPQIVGIVRIDDGSDSVRESAPPLRGPRVFAHAPAPHTHTKMPADPH
jgi:hypothetical protein